jgi:hypothetical protein
LAAGGKLHLIFLNLKMAKLSRCLYCNTGSDTITLNREKEKIAGLEKGFNYCSEACHAEILNYAARVNHESNRFLLLISGAALSFLPFLLLTLLTPYSGLFSALTTATPLILVGLVIIRYPFATPETVRYWGIRKSIFVLKRMGVVMILLGIAALTAIVILN